MNTRPNTSPLEAGNEVFHAVYGRAQEEVRDEIPVLVVSPTQLVLRRGDQRRLWPYSQPLFARAKVAAHVAVALFALTSAKSKPQDSRSGGARLAEHISDTLAESRRSSSEADEVDVLLEYCLAFAHDAWQGAVAEPARSVFAANAGPRILRITELATREQIGALHGVVEEIFGQLSTREQAELQVVVVGDHQARTRSLGMQYFKCRFREGVTDQRVTYGENVEDEEEAVSLVAKRRLDQQIARAFFGDEHRLQRDVLGDAAKHCLDAMGFTA